MGKFPKIVAAIAILIIVPKIVQKAMGLDEQSQTKKQMTAMVTDLNAKLPKEVAPGMTLTKVEFDKNVFRNNYVVDDGAGFDPAEKSKYESTAVMQVCGGASKELSKKGITVEFRYTYKDAGVDRSFDISVPPSRCT